MAFEAALAALGDAPDSGGMKVSVAEQLGRDQNALRIKQAEVADYPNDMALKKDIANTQGKLSSGNPWNGKPSAIAANDALPFAGALEALSGAANQPSLADQIPDQRRQIAPQPEPSLLDRYVKGPAEAGAALLTGTGAAVAGNLAGMWQGITGGKYGTPEGAREAAQHAQDVTESLTYAPRSEAGKEALGTVEDAFNASKLAGIGPTEAITLAGLTGGPLRAAKAASAAPEAVPGQMASVGASGANPTQMALAKVATASPEVQAQVAQAIKKVGPGQAINHDVLDRVIAADSVGVKLMRGQMTQDAEVFTREMNNRLAQPAIMNRLKEQNAQLIAKTNDIREAAAPDIYDASKPVVGQIPIDAYKRLHASEQGVIDQKWNAIRAQTGDEMIFDAGKMLQDAQAALKAKKLTTYDPGGQIAELVDDARRGGLTADGYVNWRMNLGREAMAGGNNGKAASAVIEATNNSDLLPGAAQYRDSVNDALASGRALHAKIESDPAYSAVVKGTANPETFVQKYIINPNSSIQDLQTIKQNLAHDTTAQQALSAGVIDHLKQMAKIKSTPEGDMGNFAQDSFNTALTKLRPKLGVLLDPEQGKILDNLGYTAKLVKEAPAGSAVNYSNTGVMLMGEAVKKGAEGAANFAAHGIPVGTWARKGISLAREARAVKGTLNPNGAVLLKDVGK